MRFNIFKILFFLFTAIASSSLFAQQGIGTENPDKSAALEIKSEKRGLLIPRVSLQSITDDTTISDGNVESLLVYNTYDQNNMVLGYYYWSANEGEWKRLLVEGDQLGGDNENSWLEQLTDVPATENDQDIYQMGNVAIGKDDIFISNASLDVLGSIAGGNPDQAETLGNNSIAVGDGVKATEDNSVAFGYQSEATAYGSFAGGGYTGTNPSTGNATFSKGGEASGKASFAFGNQTQAIGDYAVAMGRETQATKNGAVAMGRGTRAKGNYSLAMGESTYAIGRYSMTMGNGVRAKTENEIVLGSYNNITLTTEQPQTWDADHPLFVIGNGTGTDDRNNAITILKKGWTGIGINGMTPTTKPTEMLDVGSGRIRIRDLPDDDGDIEEDRIVVVRTAISNNQKGILRSISSSELLGNTGGPWNIQTTTNPATLNEQDIYQTGSVAIGKDKVLTASDGSKAMLDVAGAIRGGSMTATTSSAIGENSIGVGHQIKASGANAVAFGYKSEATGAGSFAGGGDNETGTGHPGGKASGISSFAFGWKSKADGDYSTAIGQDNKTLNNHAVAFGFGNESSAVYSLTAGRDNKAEAAGAVSFGRDNEAKGNYSFTVGQHLIAPSSFSTSIGSGNAIINGVGTTTIGAKNEEAIFQIGNGGSGVGTGPDRNNALTILKNANVGIGINGIEDNAKPTEMLDVGSGKVKVRELPNTDGNTTDRIVVVDNVGVLKSVESIGFGGGNGGILLAGNGLKLDDNDDTKVILGGTLEQDTEIDLNGKELRFTNLLVGEGTDEVLVVDDEGNLKKAKSMMPKFFHMPAVLMPLSENSDLDNYTYSNGTYTIDLHAIYNTQFGMTGANSVSSAGSNHTLPVLVPGDLIYNITYFDNVVFQNVSVSTSGVLTYQVNTNPNATNKTYMNIVFEVKD